MSADASTPVDDIPVVWEINEEYPDGHARPMTADELAQHNLDVAAAVAAEKMPTPPTLEDRFATVVDAVLSAPDFDIAKKQIAAITPQKSTP